MKIALVCPYEIERSGVIVFARRLATTFVRQGATTKVLSIGSDRVSETAPAQNLSTHEALERYLIEESSTYDVLFWMGLYEDLCAVQEQCQTSILLREKLGKRIFIMWERTGHAEVLPDSRLFQSFAQEGVNGILVMNDEHKDYLIKHSVPRRLVHGVSPGVDTCSEFRPARSESERVRLRKECGWPEKSAVVLSVGRFVRRKRTDLLLNAWLEDQELAKKGVLVLVGSGFGQEDSLEDQVYEMAGMSNSIMVVPHRFDANWAPYYRAADFFVQVGVVEGEPSVLSEAMASGIPVVASDVAGHRGLVRPGRTGILVKPDNKIELRAALHRLIDDKPYRRRMGLIARRIAVKERDIATVARKLLSIFEKG